MILLRCREAQILGRQNLFRYSAPTIPQHQTTLTHPRKQETLQSAIKKVGADARLPAKKPSSVV